MHKKTGDVIWKSPVTVEEINEINAAHTKPWVDPREWVIPNRPFPESYLSFLRWSNGGSFFNGDRKFDGVFLTDKIREYLLCYWIPMKMPGAVPFSFDGGGISPADLPSCASPQVVQLLEQVIRGTPVGSSAKSIDGHEELSYDRDADVRHGRCVVHTDAEDLTVKYLVEWLDRDKGQILVRTFDD